MSVADNQETMGQLTNNSKDDRLQPLIRFASRLLWSLFFTFLLLEVVTRAIWWNQPTIKVEDKEITLLPIPIVTQDHLRTLKEWSQTSDSFFIFDPVLGWSIRPNATGEDDGVTYTSNSIGIRSLREYSLAKPANITRIAAFGPSFTFGDDVPDKAAWAAQIEQARPDLEVMNWGVGGYGTDQAFLRYQTQGAAYNPDIVLIGYEENNKYRNVNYFRPFYKDETNLPLIKPTYKLEQDQLTLVKVPFDNFDSFYTTLLTDPDHFLDLTCPHDFFCNRQEYEPILFDKLASFRFVRTLVHTFVTPPEEVDRQYPVDVSLHIVEKFVEEALSHKATPVLVIFPQRDKILANYEQGKMGHPQSFIPVIQAKGGLVIDLDDAFVKAKQAQNLQYADFFIGEGGHYTEQANAIVAQEILRQLTLLGALKQ